MKITRATEATAAVADPEHFHGMVSRRILDRSDAPPASVARVSFEPGGMTAWHRHGEGQFLYVLDGEGRVELPSGERAVLGAGDLLYAPPGEVHRHGASDGQGATHLGFSFGETEWVAEPGG